MQPAEKPPTKDSKDDMDKLMVEQAKKSKPKGK